MKDDIVRAQSGDREAFERRPRFYRSNSGALPGSIGPKILSRPAFLTAEHYFEEVHGSVVSVLVPYNAEAADSLLKLSGELDLVDFNEFLFKSQQYTVELYNREHLKLKKNKDIYPLLNGGSTAAAAAVRRRSIRFSS